MPQLELNAALLLSQFVERTHETLKLKIAIDDVYLFTDSMIVLGWLGTLILNLQAYAANRVKVIKQNFSDCQWLYINSKDNPADLISRGTDPQEWSLCSLWWQGPSFLHNSKYVFSNSMSLPGFEDLPEVRNSISAPTENKVVSLTTQLKENCFDFYYK